SSVQRFLQPALAAIEAQPNVASAAAISSMPYITWGNNSNIRYEGHGTGEDPTQLPLVEMRVVTPSFFAVTKQTLVAGRLLRVSDDERPTSPPVTVVNQALARRDFPGERAVGKRFYMTDTSFATIVGVVSDIRNMGPIETPAPEMYWTYAQGGSDTDYPLMVRVTRGDPAAVVSEVRAAIHGVNANAAVSHVRPMHDVIEQSLGQPRFYLSLLGTFAAVAILLAIAGLYGVLGYAVAQRTREMGTRAALGGSVGSLVELVMRDGMRIIAFGLVGGLVGGWAATRVIQSMLYGVSPLDVPTWVGAVVLMVVVGLLAALVPALRAANQEPADAVRRVPLASSWLWRLFQAAFSISLVAAGVVCLAMREHLPARVGSFGGISLVLIGILFATPLLARGAALLLGPLARRFLGIEGRLAADNLARSPG
ncbi:MAG: FtsX-like permease family protein, partial [Gemmatimonadaceae bacterium]